MEPRRIKIQVSDIALTATLNGTETADRIWEALPFEAVSYTHLTLPTTPYV